MERPLIFPAEKYLSNSNRCRTCRCKPEFARKNIFMKKKVLKIILAAVILFAAYNIIWLTWSHIKYGKLSDGMEKGDFSSFVTPRYVYTDVDGYDYLVKYPDYLSFTGNMTVGSPTTEGNVFTDALIIWPKVSGGYDYGVLLYENDMEYAIYIDSNGNALSKEDEDIVSRHSDSIRNLLMMADERWDIYD